MFKFPSVPVDQLNERNLLPDGIYPFRVEEASYRLSENKNEMILLKLIVTTEAAKEVAVWDNLMLMESMAWKCHHFCCSIDQEQLYLDGGANANIFPGNGGMVSIITKKKGKNKQELPKSEWRNGVKDYVKPEDLVNVTSESTPGVDPNFNDDINF